MTTYAPPLREMLFAMKENGGLDAVLAQPGNVPQRPTLLREAPGCSGNCRSAGAEPRMKHANSAGASR